MNPFNVILKPIISEKSNELREKEGTYSFEVRREASKDDVRKAVKALWNADVETVNTLVRRGKVKRRGAQIFKGGNTKKAFVKLAGNAKLPLFEEQ